MKVDLIPHDEICELRLADPPGNILDREGCGEIARLVRERGNDPACKAIVFSSTGKHFSYGASVPEHRAGLVQDFLPAFHDLFAALIETELPMIATVRGFCLGGAFELAAFCNFLLADETAVFGVPEIQLGVFPPVACALFPCRFGGAMAEDLVLSGRRIEAREARERGIVSRLATGRSLEEELDSFLADQILPRSGIALRHAQGALRQQFHGAFLKHLKALERSYLEELMSTRDAKEGIEAFLERREPAWTNA